MTNADFVVALIDNFMEEPSDGDASGNYNPLTGLTSRQLENYYNGSRPIGKKNASKILRHTDKERFESFFEPLTNDALAALANTFVEIGIEVTALDLPAICADSLEDVLRLCSVGGKTPSKNTSTVEAAAEIMPDTTQKRFKQLKNITPPEEVAEQEILYIKKLMDVYREAEGIAEFSRDTLKQYDSKYGEHFKRQRKDFYAAESVRQGTRETYGETDPDQFEVLKEETYDGVIDVWEQYYSNGLVRLNTVLA
jgi:hypothetical protein